MNVIVVGGGAAGMMAAYSAAENGAKVTCMRKMRNLVKRYLSQARADVM